MTPARGDRDQGAGLWMAIGAVGAMGLALALVPLRAYTSASNLAFAFIVLTIVIAELAGRGAGLVTAVVSAMSLNFFLTQPYLSLRIDQPDDLIAFVALALCGLVAAAFGRRRQQFSAAARRSQHDVDVLKQMVSRLRAGSGLEDILASLRDAFGLGRVQVRRSDGSIVAASPAGALPAPAAELDADSLMDRADTQHWWGPRGFRLPEGGGRIVLSTDLGPISLELWEGTAQGLDPYERRTLSIAASILALEISRRASAA